MTDTIDSTTRVVVSPSVYCREFGSELVLLEFARGDYFGLDETGAEIWRGLAKGEDLGTIADHMAARYEVVREEVLRDIVALVTKMREHALIDLASSPSK